ncbi:TP53-regulated inhibitor of apoptosis 1-like isoform X2 [Planococcus citri]|uniref:TP53-regulated inhibitor of apoptosis 1-like isoform X2 n=1 Tax=Planococcus citri TaxID=170843 RepID=UPI0031F7D7A7
MSENYPMESCRQLKEQYEACFNVWFPEKFLKGDNNDSMCKELLKSYTDCVQKNMKEHNISIKEIENDNFEVEKNAKPQSSSNSK